MILPDFPWFETSLLMLAQPLTATADLMFLGYIFFFFFTRLPGLSFGGGGGGVRFKKKGVVLFVETGPN